MSSTGLKVSGASAGRLARPSQLGPRTRIPLAASSGATDSRMPSPAPMPSPKPELTITATRTPQAAHSRSTWATSSARTITRARSTGSGRSRTEAYAVTPCTSPPLPFTGYTLPG